MSTFWRNVVKALTAGVFLLAPVGCAQFYPKAAASDPVLRATQATVWVGNELEHGTGVVIDKDLVLTAGHVAADQDSLEIATYDGRKLKGTVVWIGDKGVDLALLKVSTGIEPVPVSCEMPYRGEDVFTYGFPRYLKDVMTWGRVASDTMLEGKDISVGSMVLDMTVAPGNSGGGVFNDQGQLVGVIDALVPMPVPVSPFGMSFTFTGLSIMTNAPTICTALGRKS